MSDINLKAHFPNKRSDTLRRLARRYERLVGGAGDAAECWLWMGAKNKAGYGSLSVGSGSAVYATHLALLFDGRPRMGSAWALHSCDNPSCVNPKHLRWGTSQDNVDDREARGRSVKPRGEHHGQAKLTEEQVRYIRSCGKRLGDLKEELGVSMTVLCLARQGKTWGHVR